MFRHANITENTWVGLALALGTVWLSLDGLHYWHDIRFAYAATHFSISEILLGTFHPEQLGGAINEQVAGGFYLAKVLHLWLLQFLFTIISPDKGGFDLTVWVFVFLMGAWTFLGYCLWRQIFGNEWFAWLAWICMLLLPITPYLSGKLLSEVPSLLCITLSILALHQSRNVSLGQCLMFGIVSGLCLLLAGLFRLDCILAYVGFSVSLIWYAETPRERRDVGLSIFVSATVLFIGYCCFLWYWDVSPEILLAYYQGFIHAGQKSLAMSILGTATFGGVVFLLAIGALFRHHRLSSFFIVWFLVSCGPIMLITWQYMIEPRYLVNGILPLAGLGAIGLDFVVRKMKSYGLLRPLFVVVSIVLVFGMNGLIVKVMPYELDRVALTKTVNMILQQDSQATILIPWAYTDFHFLQMVFPDVSVKNVHTPEGRMDISFIDGKWGKRLADWYGDTYVSHLSQVIPFWGKGAVYYVGWTLYPPAEFVKRISEDLGLMFIVQKIDQLGLNNHLEESWLWGNSDVMFSPIGRVGQYQYFSLAQIEK